MERRPKIKCLDGFKIIATLLIVWHHIGGYDVFDPKFDIGARMVEFFFVVSGFLVGYNSYNKVQLQASPTQLINENNSRGGGILKKFLMLWPLHVLMLLANIAIRLFRKIPLSAKNIPVFLSNLFLLQAWNMNDAFSYNGVSWFLSALLFCYYVSPVLIKHLKSIKISSIYLILFAVARIAIELIDVKLHYQIFPFIPHTSPILRCLEFGIGLFSIPLFIKLLDYIKKFNKKALFSIFSLIEIVVLGLCIYLMLAKNTTWIRGYFVIVYLVLIFAFAFEKGIISKILSMKPLMLLNKIEFEIFLCHSIIADVTTILMHKIFPTFNNPALMIAICYVSIIIVCSLYKKLIYPLHVKIVNKLLQPKPKLTEAPQA